MQRIKLYGVSVVQRLLIPAIDRDYRGCGVFVDRPKAEAAILHTKWPPVHLAEPREICGMSQ